MPPIAKPDVCSRCHKNAKAEEMGYCGRCIVEVIENRVKRKLGALATGKIVIACSNKKSLQCSTAAYLIKRMAKRQTPIKGRAGRKAAVIAKCADETAADFIRKLTAGCSNNAFSPESKNQAINMFESITEKELELYAAIKKIKYTKGKNTRLRQKIQKLQSRYPGTIEALAQSSRRVGEL